VLSINEIVGYDAYSKSFSFIEAFHWNPERDIFEFPGYMNSHLLEEKIAIRRGIPPHKKRAIYKEIKARAKIFERLHKGKKVRDFHDVFKVLAEAHRQGFF